MLPGYTIIDRLDETLQAVVYRAYKNGAPGTVIIKALKNVCPSPSEIVRFRHEYDIIRSIELPGVVQIRDVIANETGLALVLEDFQGAPLKDLIPGGFSLERFLDLAVRLTEILGVLHQQGIAHRDIKPGNILFDAQADVVKITDFGIAAEITRCSGEIYHASVLEDTLVYLSPEQTGRMNCAVDYRTDFYSLGITFYEMLSGRPPFQSSDPMEIIHAHIAKEPAPLQTVNPDVPAVVSDIVMKLLSKAAQDRYQNSFGLLADLRECQQRLSGTGRIEAFALGRHDIALRFTIPRVLVGRDGEIAKLEEFFARVSEGGVEVVLVTGEPGIGKTSLVHELHKKIAGKHGYFAEGKYDQMRRYVPYSSIIQAFQGLARQLFTESEARIRQWKDALLANLGPNGRIITDVIPEMELIIGEQPEIPLLGLEEAQNRFNMAFKGFIRVFAAREHPLVLFLDDLQWADSASLSLIRTITTDPGLAFFFLIGSYRHTEVAAYHPLMLVVDEMRKAGITVASLALQALQEGDVNGLVANILRCDPVIAAPLSRVVSQKTMGNPFFIIEFLKTLHEENHLVLDAAYGWKWDIDAISAMMVTDNVVDFMTAKISRLPEAARDLIQMCACAGSRFDIETLSAVLNRPLQEILVAMDELARYGLIHYAQNTYRFPHDRIQEAAYAMIPLQERARLHHQIGRRSLETTPPDQLAARIFHITDQFNQARSLIKTPQEQDALVNLNLKAGLKAKDAMAYSAAVDYLNVALDFLPERTWKEQYDQTYTIYMELMECEYLSRHFEESERLFAEVTKRAKNKEDRAKAYHTMVVLYTNTGQINQAIDLGIEGVRMFGVRLSRNAGKFAVLRELIVLRMRLKKIGIEHIPDLPMMSNEEKIRTAQLYGGIGTPAYYTNPNLFAVTVLKGINMDMIYGITHTTAFGFIAIATIIGSDLGDYQTAYRISEMALSLNEKLNDKRFACKVYFVFSMLILHWTRPMRESIDFYRKAFMLGLDTGDLIYCGHSINAMLMCRITMGDNIDDILNEHGRFKDFIEGTKDPFLIAHYREAAHFCLNMKGLTVDLGSLKTETYDPDENLEAMRQQGNLANVFFSLVIREKIQYLYGLYADACQIGDELDAMLEVPRGTFHLSEHCFYRCLSLLAVWRDSSPAQRRRIRSIVKGHQKRMRKWADNAPANYLHKYLLIEAEKASVNGRFQAAAGLYRQAIRSAQEHGYTQNEAIANERAARSYLAQGYDEIAAVYLQAAHEAYQRLGARRKAGELEKAYPVLIRREGKPRSSADTGPELNTSGMEMASTFLDLTTVMQVSQVISSEIVLERLLQKIMRMSVVNAGAQRGFFIGVEDGNLTIKARHEGGEAEISVMSSDLLEERESLARAIVYYVFRSGENVILGNAAQEGAFVNDTYIMRNRCKSILCITILNKGSLSGILYMENNLTANAFTPERLELLRIISAQAAISLENARLFELATTDGLTKLYVQRYFHFLLDKEIQHSQRHGRGLSIIMIDIDDFKRFNDTYGHQLGDEVLRSVAATMKQNTRTMDVVARYGGEEFVIILPESGSDNARTTAEKIRRFVEEMEIPYGRETLHVTISLGVASFPLHAGQKDDLIRAADEALYTSKHAGKNRVTVRGEAHR